MVRFVIIRHGYSQANKEKRYSGQTDVPLDKIGYEQAVATARYVLEHFQVDSVFSSDLSRAVHTVKPIAEALGISVHTCRALREVDTGDWTGKLISEVEQEYAESFKIYKETPRISRFDGGESYAALMARSKQAIEEIARDHDGKTVVIGTHGGVIRALRAAFGEEERAEDKLIVTNGSVTVADYDDGNMNWLVLGYAEHLKNEICLKEFNLAL